MSEQLLNTIKSTLLLNSILDWAEARNLILGAKPKDQFVKTVEELGEIAAGMARNDLDKVKDGIGDVIVTLTILAAQYGLTIEECLQQAYNDIKDRKGKMIDGIFVKEGDTHG